MDFGAHRRADAEQGRRAVSTLVSPLSFALCQAADGPLCLEWP
jgi:hypothetical protein